MSWFSILPRQYCTKDVPQSCFVVHSWRHRPTNPPCVITYSEACASWSLPTLLSHQPLLHPRLQRSPRRSLQRCYPQQQHPTSRRCSTSSSSTAERAQATWTRSRLQPEQPRQARRLPKQRYARQQRSEHVSGLRRMAGATRSTIAIMSFDIDVRSSGSVITRARWYFQFSLLLFVFIARHDWCPVQDVITRQKVPPVGFTEVSLCVPFAGFQPNRWAKQTLQSCLIQKMVSPTQVEPVKVLKYIMSRGEFRTVI